jgi:hypothetical protein
MNIRACWSQFVGPSKRARRTAGNEREKRAAPRGRCDNWNGGPGRRRNGSDDVLEGMCRMNGSWSQFVRQGKQYHGLPEMEGERAAQRPRFFHESSQALTNTNDKMTIDKLA